MTKWTRTRRDPGRIYDNEAVRELVEIGLEAESDYVDLINKLEPGMTKDRRRN